MKDLRDKVALITGAGSGFGREFAREACKRGDKSPSVLSILRNALRG